MAREYAKILTRLCRDPDWKHLSGEAQWLHHTLYTQPDLSRCGVLPYKPRMWAGFTTNWSIDVIVAAAEELERRGWVVIDLDTDELWIRFFIRDDGILNNTKNVKGCAAAYDAVHSERIRRRIPEVLPDGLRERFPTAVLAADIPTLRKWLDEPFAEPLQMGLDLETAGRSPIGRRSVDDGMPDRSSTDPPATCNLQPATCIPQPAPDSDGTFTGPDLTVVGEDPLITKAMDVIAERETQQAVLNASTPIRSRDGLRRYKLTEARKTFVVEARHVLDVYVIDTAELLADVLVGARNRQYLTRRHG